MDLNPDQFQAVVADIEGEQEQTFSTKTHRRGLTSIENIKTGDLWRHSWQHGHPFQRATGAALHDPDYPTMGDEDEARMFVIPTARSFSPHQPEGSPMNVIRERKKPRAS